MLIVFAKLMTKGDIQLVFLDNVEPQKPDAKSISAEITKILENYQISGNKMVSIAEDGTNVMGGKFNGVIAELKKKFPQIIYIHDLSHRLALCTRKTLLGSEIRWRVKKSRVQKSRDKKPGNTNPGIKNPGNQKSKEQKSREQKTR